MSTPARVMPLNTEVIMKTSEEIEAEFRKEFQALVDKYKAEVEIKDHWQGYAECGQDIKCMVYIGAT